MIPQALGVRLAPHGSERCVARLMFHVEHGASPSGAVFHVELHARDAEGADLPLRQERQTALKAVNQRVGSGPLERWDDG